MSEEEEGNERRERREVERSDPDFSISSQDACSLDRDKHQGHNKVWINEQAISAATIEFESFVLRPNFLVYLSIETFKYNVMSAFVFSRNDS